MKTATGLAALTLTLAACGSSHPTPAAHPSSRLPTTAAAPAAPAFTCSDISADLARVVKDLKYQDAHYQEAWVTGGDGHDLHALMNDTRNAVIGGSPVESDAATFNSDASTYVADNSPYLAPGWKSEYNAVTSDINTLAGDCHQPTAPPS